MSEPSFVAETLAWCNEMRAERDLEPLAVLPRGRRQDPRSCPCGKATGLRVYSYYCDEGEATPSFDTPGSVFRFIAAFDAGELPQYDEAA